MPKNIHRIDEINNFRKPQGMDYQNSDLLSYGVADLERKILEVGPDNICCIVGETISGGLTGFVPRPEGYWKAIKEICLAHDIILIADEIICGTGSTGTFYCWEQDSVAPHITVIGKTLAGGYFPCNALLIDKLIADQIEKSCGRIQQSNTFQGHSLAISVALHIQDIITERSFLADVLSKGQLAKNLLEERLGSSQRFLGCSGRGMRYSVQLKGSKTDLFARFVTKRCEESANILIDGKWHRITFSPQLDFPEEELLSLTNTFCDVFLEVDKLEAHMEGFQPSNDLQRRY